MGIYNLENIQQYSIKEILVLIVYKKDNYLLIIFFCGINRDKENSKNKNFRRKNV